VNGDSRVGRRPPKGFNVKISQIETFKYWVEKRPWLFVRVVTDEGLYGWGEASLEGTCRAVEAAIHEIGDVLIGQDPSGMARHWQALYHAYRYRGGIVLASAVAGLDIALWDLEGKRLGVPVYRLLGGPFRDRIRCYASHWLWNVETPQQAHDGAREAVRRGFSAFKWNPLRAVWLRNNEERAIGRAAELMAAAREGAGPDVDIFIDCGECLSPRTALAAASALAPYRLGWIEEPIAYDNPKEMVRLAQRMPVPIATGERLYTRWEYRELLEGGGCNVIQPDLTHAAGISEVLRIASLADTHYVSVAPHNAAGPIGHLASIHLAAAIPNFYILEQMEDARQFRDNDCVTEPIIYSDGHFELPTGPGLGTDLRLDVLREREFHPHPLNISSESRWH
jgi:galactonate dehydratase